MLDEVQGIEAIYECLCFLARVKQEWNIKIFQILNEKDF